MDIEGFEEEDDGKPKTPAPVRQIDLLESHVILMRSPVMYIYTQMKMYQLATKYIYKFTIFVLFNYHYKKQKNKKKTSFKKVYTYHPHPKPLDCVGVILY